jgi:hypothetical protein
MVCETIRLLRNMAYIPKFLDKQIIESYQKYRLKRNIEQSIYQSALDSGVSISYAKHILGFDKVPPGTKFLVDE